MGQFDHSWDVTPQDAIAIQDRLREAVTSHDRTGPVQYVAGIDVGFEEAGTATNAAVTREAVTRAAVAVLRFPDLELVDQAIAHMRTTFPYIPGLLSFRETPAVLQALTRLKTAPDLLICDGQGYAHPRRFGLACHIGLLCGIPSIGAAKKRLIGQHAPLGTEKGAQQPLLDREETVGMVVRTRTNVKPMYVSVGHRISLETAVQFVLACTPRFRLPETTRWAHRLASGK
jgi:deoxyribonuclease V